MIPRRRIVDPPAERPCASPDWVSTVLSADELLVERLCRGNQSGTLRLPVTSGKQIYIIWRAGVSQCQNGMPQYGQTQSYSLELDHGKRFLIPGVVVGEGNFS
jgi:hypothetical protein